MIFVTLGTQDKPFTRLVNKIEELYKKGIITGEVIVQAGPVNMTSNNLTIMDFVSMDDFKKYIQKSDYLIVHGGVGSILDGLKNDKKIIAVPRLSKYGEQKNDHQLQIVSEFAEKGYIIGCNDVNDLENAIKQLNSFKPKKYTSNNGKFVNLIESFIDKN